jgi:hypothetical protein
MSVIASDRYVSVKELASSIYENSVTEKFATVEVITACAMVIIAATDLGEEYDTVEVASSAVINGESYRLVLERVKE